MTKRLSPNRLAGEITIILDNLYPSDTLDIERFPINIAKFSQDYSNEKFPDDPITRVQGESLGEFEGGLFAHPNNKKEWAIIYNTDINFQGRINFTLAHEFGHYLLHRKDYPDGIRCNSQDTENFNPDYESIEHEANEFAANLLMPLNDFRKQINPDVKITLKDVNACAERYQTSLTATIFQWLKYTERRAMLVNSRDGFIRWAISSETAHRTGLYFKTKNNTIKTPCKSLAYSGNRGEITHKAGIWKNEPCEEICFISEQHDFSFSLLHYDDKIIENEYGEEIEEEDLYEKMKQPRF